MDPGFRGDRDFALTAVRQSSEALKLVAPALMADRELILEAVRQDWRVGRLRSSDVA